MCRSTFIQRLPPSLYRRHISRAAPGKRIFPFDCRLGMARRVGYARLAIDFGWCLDRFPRLRIIIGHMGENLPYSLMRAQDGLPPSVTGLKYSISEYFLGHFVITTSGYFTQPPFLCALQVMGAERILYSVDYPYRSNNAGARFLEGIQLPLDDLRKIASENASRILKLKIK